MCDNDMMEHHRGPRGERGLQGIGGAEGPRGIEGAQGIQGLQGIRGLRGDEGIQGETGPEGKTGPKGNTGAQGTPGYGIQGLPGVTGAQGPMGFNGTPGGPTGPTGSSIKGDTGAQGDSIKGDTGAQGETGAQGATGAQGDSIKGDTGAQGVTGPAGGGSGGGSISDGIFTIADNSAGNGLTNNSKQFPNFAGLIIMNEYSAGKIGFWLCSGGAVINFMTSTTMGATFGSVTEVVPIYGANIGTMSYNSDIAGYEWTNTENLAGPFTFTVIQTKNTA
jgi:hypothetical protein